MRICGPASHVAVPGELRGSLEGWGVEESSVGRQEKLPLGYGGTWFLKPKWSFENQKRRCNGQCGKKGTCYKSRASVCRAM